MDDRSTARRRRRLDDHRDSPHRRDIARFYGPKYTLTSPSPSAFPGNAFRNLRMGTPRRRRRTIGTNRISRSPVPEWRAKNGAMCQCRTHDLTKELAYAITQQSCQVTMDTKMIEKQCVELADC